MVAVHLWEVLPPDIWQACILLSVPCSQDGDALAITACHLMKSRLKSYTHATDSTTTNQLCDVRPLHHCCTADTDTISMILMVVNQCDQPSGECLDAFQDTELILNINWHSVHVIGIPKKHD